MLSCIYLFKLNSNQECAHEGSTKPLPEGLNCPVQGSSSTSGELWRGRATSHNSNYNSISWRGRAVNHEFQLNWVARANLSHQPLASKVTNPFKNCPYSHTKPSTVTPILASSSSSVVLNDFFNANVITCNKNCFHFQ